MREFKFKAWDNRQKEIHYWESLKCNSISVAYLFNNTDLKLLQYIGRKDNNNVEIYEGDICKIKYSKDSQKNSLCEESVGLVEYFDSSFWLNSKKDKFSVIIDISEELEVIGNIYENPELLK